MLQSLLSVRLRAALTLLGRDQRGVTAVEYGVVAALIVVVCLVAINNLGQIVLVNLYERIAAAVTR